MPKPLGRGAAASNGRFPKEAFTDDAATDTYRCPNGETLSTHGESTARGHRLVLYYHPTACRRCPLQSQCTSNKRWRRIARWEGEAVLDAMAAQLAANPQMTKRGVTRSSIPSARSSTP